MDFTLDALGRHRTRSIGGSLTDTYGYIGASDAVVLIDQPSGSVSSLIDGLGNRLATKTHTGALGWIVPDLHGDVAAVLSSTGASITDAFRYDAYGVTLSSVTSALPTPWRYQGRLLLNSAGNTDLYDFVARAYDPALGAFTSLDTVAGSAQNPITLNRFLYANANPETLIDPDGHEAGSPFDFLADVAGNVGEFGAGFGEGVVSAVEATVTGTVELGKAALGAAADAGGCAVDAKCRAQAIASAGEAVKTFARDPGEAVRTSVNAAGNAIGAAATGAVDMVRSTVARVGTAWTTGNFRELGRMAGETATNFVPVGGILNRVGAIGRLATAGRNAVGGLARGGGNLGRALSGQSHGQGRGHPGRRQ